MLCDINVEANWNFYCQKFYLDFRFSAHPNRSISKWIHWCRHWRSSLLSTHILWDFIFVYSGIFNNVGVQWWKLRALTNNSSQWPSNIDKNKYAIKKMTPLPYTLIWNIKVFITYYSIICIIKPFFQFKSLGWRVIFAANFRTKMDIFIISEIFITTITF